MHNGKKVGLGVITCNRPDYLKQCLDSLDSACYDILFVINDGDKLAKNIEKLIASKKGLLSHNEKNLGVAKTKNKALSLLLENGCDYLFLIEDDMIVKDNSVFEQYIFASEVTGIQHFNYGPGSPFNRKQTIQNYDLHNRHLLDEKSELNPKLVVSYKHGVDVALYEHTVAMFSFFTKKAIQEVGLFPEEYDRCWEHVDHTYQIIKADMHPQFWWFADIPNSDEFLEEAPEAIKNSSIAKDKNEWMQRVLEGREIYKNKHGHYPNQPPIFSQEEVVAKLKEIHSNYAIIK